jgi:prepilin-type processing-associated H-X9-DG protein
MTSASPLAPAAAVVAVASPVAPAPAPAFFGVKCCEVSSSITSNFNGTAIAKNNCVWFNSIVKVKGRNGGDANVNFVDGHVKFSAGGTDYDIKLPDSRIVFSSTTTEAGAEFDCGARAWRMDVPSSYADNVFLDGASFRFPDGLKGGVKDIVWSGTFTSDSCDLSFEWKWAAAVYPDLPDCEDGLCVKPIDGDKLNPFHNSDHAGTPECFKDDVIGGARGGGGSNFTGSYSGTATASCQ